MWAAPAHIFRRGIVLSVLHAPVPESGRVPENRSISRIAHSTFHSVDLETLRASPPPPAAWVLSFRENKYGAADRWLRQDAYRSPADRRTQQGLFAPRRRQVRYPALPAGSPWGPQPTPIVVRSISINRTIGSDTNVF